MNRITLILTILLTTASCYSSYREYTMSEKKIALYKTTIKQAISNFASHRIQRNQPTRNNFIIAASHVLCLCNNCFGLEISIENEVAAALSYIPKNDPIFENLHDQIYNLATIYHAANDPRLQDPLKLKFDCIISIAASMDAALRQWPSEQSAGAKASDFTKVTTDVMADSQV